MLPAIYFLFSRNDCQAFAASRRHLPLTVTAEQTSQIAHILAHISDTARGGPPARPGPGHREPGAQGHRLPPRRPAAGAQAARRGAVRAGPDAGRLRDRHPRARVKSRRHGGRRPMSKWDGRQKRTLIPNEFQQMPAAPVDAHGRVRPRRHPLLAVDSFREMLDVAIGPRCRSSRPSRSAPTPC